MAKVLVAAPVYEGMAYCLNEFIESLGSLDYPDFKILLIDNSRTKKFFRQIKQLLGVKVIHDDTEEEKNILRVVSSRNKILDYAKEKNYDYLLMMDSDVMVPPNLLKDLIEDDKDVVSGIYFNPFQVDGFVRMMPVCWKGIDSETWEEVKRKNLNQGIIQKKEDVRRYLTEGEIKSGEVQEVSVPSAGCLLLSKKAIRSGAKYGLLTESVHTTDDIYFFKELKEKGFKLYCDPKLICRHEFKEKYLNGKHKSFG